MDNWPVCRAPAMTIGWSGEQKQQTARERAGAPPCPEALALRQAQQLPQNPMLSPGSVNVPAVALNSVYASLSMTVASVIGERFKPSAAVVPADAV